MSKIFKESQSNCLVCDTEFLFDPSLSYAEKGMLATILAIPDGCKISLNDLTVLSGEKKKDVKKIWKKLIKLGYLVSSPLGTIVRDFRVELDNQNAYC